MIENKELRRRIIELAYAHNISHAASALSCVDIIKKIYDKADKDDVFVLSKGHGSLALYAVLETKGFKPEIKAHPDRDPANGIYCTTGSLGHGLPIGVGSAMAKKMKKEKGMVRVLMGDGELEEGTSWESFLVCERFSLDNLEIYIDNNGYQAISSTLYPVVDWLKKMQRPNVFFTDTKKGHGCSVFGKLPDAHVHPLTEDEYRQCLKELA
jgi:transketolase